MNQIMFNVHDLKREQNQLLYIQEQFPGSSKNETAIRKICQKGINRNQRQIKKTETAINQLRDETLKKVAWLRSSGSTIAAIAADVNYSERHCARLLKQAVAEIEILGYTMI